MIRLFSGLFTVIAGFIAADLLLLILCSFLILSSASALQRTLVWNNSQSLLRLLIVPYAFELMLF